MQHSNQIELITLLSFYDQQLTLYHSVHRSDLFQHDGFCEQIDRCQQDHIYSYPGVSVTDEAHQILIL